MELSGRTQVTLAMTDEWCIKFSRPGWQGNKEGSKLGSALQDGGLSTTNKAL